ncbi:MAG: sulfatase-like hydrolase/transferase [Deltaproteobacteria bacterium]|nr:sulfatase-like hydrolase/transferase [Deltaproteobacteria bacterium]
MTTHEEERGWRRWRGLIAPSRPALLFALGGALLEAAMLAASAESAYRMTPRAWWLVPLWLGGFWLGLGWLLDALGRLAARLLAGRSSGLRGKATVAALLAALLLAVSGPLTLYVVSWTLYLRSGLFADAETVRFLFANPLLMADTQIAQATLAEAGSLLTVAAALVALPLLLRRFSRAVRWPSDRRTMQIRAGVAILWLAGMALALDAGPGPVSDMRRRAHDLAIRRGLGPVLTLWRSQQRVREPIAAVLQPEDLRPRDGTPWPIPPADRRPDLVFVKIESLRHDVIGREHQGRLVMPRLSALAERAVVFERAYAPTTHTDYSDPSVLASLHPLRTRKHHYYRSSDPWPRTLVYDLCAEAGYETALFSSENERWGSKDAFLQTPGLQLFHDAERSGEPTRVLAEDTGVAEAVRLGDLQGGVLDDARTTSAALAWLQARRASGKPVFLYLNLQSSHFPYYLPSASPRPFSPSAMDFGASFVDYPARYAEQARNAYFNALAEADRQLGRLLDALGPGAVLVLFGDHGEAFHEHGQVTHGRLPTEPVARTAALIAAPGRLPPRRERYPLALIDLVPTTLAAMGWAPHPNFQGIDALAADRPALAERLVFAHVENPLARIDAVWAAGRWKLVRDRMRGGEALFDLENDPEERRNLLAGPSPPPIAPQLGAVLTRWRSRQLAYYHFPHYYQRSWPPAQPTL